MSFRRFFHAILLVSKHTQRDYELWTR